MDNVTRYNKIVDIIYMTAYDCEILNHNDTKQETVPLIEKKVDSIIKNKAKEFSIPYFFYFFLHVIFLCLCINEISSIYSFFIPLSSFLFFVIRRIKLDRNKMKKVIKLKNLINESNKVLNNINLLKVNANQITESDFMINLYIQEKIKGVLKKNINQQLKQELSSVLNKQYSNKDKQNIFQQTIRSLYILNRENEIIINNI